VQWSAPLGGLVLASLQRGGLHGGQPVVLGLWRTVWRLWDPRRWLCCYGCVFHSTPRWQAAIYIVKVVKGEKKTGEHYMLYCCL
jgi:hypothetical protein